MIDLPLPLKPCFYFYFIIIIIIFFISALFKLKTLVNNNTWV